MLLSLQDVMVRDFGYSEVQHDHQDTKDDRRPEDKVR